MSMRMADVLAGDNQARSILLSNEILRDFVLNALIENQTIHSKAIRPRRQQRARDVDSFFKYLEKVSAYQAVVIDASIDYACRKIIEKYEIPVSPEQFVWRLTQQGVEVRISNLTITDSEQTPEDLKRRFSSRPEAVINRRILFLTPDEVELKNAQMSADIFTLVTHQPDAYRTDHFPALSKLTIEKFLKLEPLERLFEQTAQTVFAEELIGLPAAPNLEDASPVLHKALTGRDSILFFDAPVAPMYQEETDSLAEVEPAQEAPGNLFYRLETDDKSRDIAIEALTLSACWVRAGMLLRWLLLQQMQISTFSSPPELLHTVKEDIKALSASLNSPLKKRFGAVRQALLQNLEGVWGAALYESVDEGPNPIMLALAVAGNPDVAAAARSLIASQPINPTQALLQLVRSGFLQAQPSAEANLPHGAARLTLIAGGENSILDQISEKTIHIATDYGDIEAPTEVETFTDLLPADLLQQTVDDVLGLEISLEDAVGQSNSALEDQESSDDNDLLPESSVAADNGDDLSPPTNEPSGEASNPDDTDSPDQIPGAQNTGAPSNSSGQPQSPSPESSDEPDSELEDNGSEEHNTDNFPEGDESDLGTENPIDNTGSQNSADEPDNSPSAETYEIDLSEGQFSVDISAENSQITFDAIGDRQTYSLGQTVNISIHSFGGVGTGTSFGALPGGDNSSDARQERADEVDTLRFTGDIFRKENFWLVQKDENLILRFSGLDGFSIILRDFDLRLLDNIPNPNGNNSVIGNLGLFNPTQGFNLTGETEFSLQDDFDVVQENRSLDRNLSNHISFLSDSGILEEDGFRPDRELFLNGEDNSFSGLDEVRNIVDGLDGNDTLNGGEKDDTLIGGKGEDVLYGGMGNDSLTGGDGNDTLNGGEKDDTLIGGKGEDVLYGGMGDDSLTGGDGNDRFVLSRNEGIDTITDFNPQEDKLVLEDDLAVSEIDFRSTMGSSGQPQIDILLGGTDQVIAQLQGVHHQPASIESWFTTQP